MLLARHKIPQSNTQKFIKENKSVIFLEALNAIERQLDQKSKVRSEVKDRKIEFQFESEKKIGNVKVWKLQEIVKKREKSI